MSDSGSQAGSNPADEVENDPDTKPLSDPPAQANDPGPDMDDPAGQAFTAASEATKQVVAVATGIVAITVAFLQNLKAVAPDNLDLLHVAWISAGVSVFFGIWTLLTLTGKVGRRGSVPKRGDIYSPGVRLTAGLMIVSFLVTLGFTIAFGVSAT